MKRIRINHIKQIVKGKRDEDCSTKAFNINIIYDRGADLNFIENEYAKKHHLDSEPLIITVEGIGGVDRELETKLYMFCFYLLLHHHVRRD